MKIRPITHVLITGIVILGVVQLLGLNGMFEYAYLAGATLVALGLLAVYEVLHTNWTFSISSSLKDLSSLSPQGAERLKSAVIQEVVFAILFIPTFLVFDRMLKRLMPLQDADAGNQYFFGAVLTAFAIFSLMRFFRHIRL
ncbi:MAG: hypothetical protein JWL86_5964 [Rhizobium sp.]|nr:hypothetical protein [Rhizobium sp.]